jgi:hypothetical protein
LPDPLDLTALICDPFFRVKPGLGRNGKGHPVVTPGQLVWAHQLYPPVRPFIIEVKGYDPRDARNNSYVVSQLRAEQGTHFPTLFGGVLTGREHWLLICVCFGATIERSEFK